MEKGHWREVTLTSPYTGTACVQFSKVHRIIWCTVESKGPRQRYVTVFVDIINSTNNSFKNYENFNTIFINHFMDILRYQISTCFTRYTEPMAILHVCQHRFYSIATKNHNQTYYCGDKILVLTVAIPSCVQYQTIEYSTQHYCQFNKTQLHISVLYSDQHEDIAQKLLRNANMHTKI